jgi:hypothetical protein
MRFSIAFLACSVSASACAQTLNAPAEVKAPPPAAGSVDALTRIPGPMGITPAVELLTDFKESDVKFAFPDLIDILRDRRHEGWVLAAYPDPKTGQPLIGAGFSLDLPAREHPQTDPLNPHPFLEPSSAELWQAAGLPPQQLDQILTRFHQRFATWSKKQFRNHIRSLDPDIREEDATLLLRVGIIQAIYNARAYCRNFDQLTPSQQMALSQLVYQMGVNLQEFSQFLGLINGSASSAPDQQTAVPQDTEYWNSVQQSLVHSQWARLYRTRATAVIAMLDPRYDESPVAAERRISAVLRPAVMRRHRGRSAGSRQVASNSRSGAGHPHKVRSHGRGKRKAA